MISLKHYDKLNINFTHISIEQHKKSEHQSDYLYIS